MIDLPSTLPGWLVTLQAERDASPRTLSTYAEGANAFLRAGFAALDTASVERFALHLAQHGASSATRKIRLAALRSWGRYLERAYQIPPVTWPAIRVASAGKRLPRAVELAHLQTLLDAPPASTPRGIRDRAWLHVLAGAGLRVSELCALDVEDYRDAALTVRSGKGGRDRVVPLPAPARAALARWLETRSAPEGQRALFVTLGGGSLGQRLTRRRADEILRHWCGLHGIPIVSPHALRHTYATRLLRAGADISEVQAALGHASIATTSRYLHADPARLRAAVDRLSQN